MARKSNHRKHKKARKTYSIIVDGQTEVWYLQMLKKNEDLPRIDIKPELPRKKKLSDQFKSVINNSKIYDKVIWLVDFDTILKETRERKAGSISALQELQGYKKVLKKDFPNAQILINTPCLEIWLLLHFEPTGKFYPDCEGAEKRLKKSHLEDYEKTEKYYKKRDNDFYQRLKENQSSAIKNAKALGKFDFNNPNKGVAEIYQLFELFKL